MKFLTIALMALISLPTFAEITVTGKKASDLKEALRSIGADTLNII
jgi:hypothetical protein